LKLHCVLGATLLLAMPLIGQAQPAGVTPEMIATSLPEAGAPKAKAGPYAVTAELAFGTDRLRVYRPTRVERFPNRDTLPVVIWGNGGCAIDNPRYGGFLSTIASHGFLVITTAGAAPAGGARRQATADDLRAAIDWAAQENSRADSPLQGRIQVQQVAVMGQSCGGALALALGADPRVRTIGVFNSGVQPKDPSAAASTFPTAEALRALHGPVLLINGHERDFMMERSRATYDAIDGLPAFYGSRHGAGHTATAYHPGGGEFANVATNWVLWQFKGDKRAGEMFLGKHCGLCTNKNWDVASKGLSK
jgi:Chlorophyllase